VFLAEEESYQVRTSRVTVISATAELPPEKCWGKKVREKPRQENEGKRKRKKKKGVLPSYLPLTNCPL